MQLPVSLSLLETNLPDRAAFVGGGVDERNRSCRTEREGFTLEEMKGCRAPPLLAWLVRQQGLGLSLCFCPSVAPHHKERSLVGGKVPCLRAKFYCFIFFLPGCYCVSNLQTGGRVTDTPGRYRCKSFPSAFHMGTRNLTSSLRLLWETSFATSTEWYTMGGSPTWGCRKV